MLSGALLGLASGSILVPLNSTMLAVALPSLVSEFAVDAATVATLVTLYLGAVVVVLPASGALGDRFGHRRIFLIGVTGFAASSLVAAFAPAFAILAVARVLQAATGALVSTSAISLVRASAAPGRRGAMFGLFDMLISTSAALGPFIGGLLVFALGWRSLFLLALPVAVVAGVTVGLLPRLRESERATTAEGRGPGRPVDLIGLVVLALVLSALLLVLLHGFDTLLGIVSLIALPVLLAVFVLRELRVASPALDLHLFRRPAFGAALLGVLGMTIILHAAFILVPFQVEELLDGTASTSGVVLLGISGVGAVAAPFAGRISDRVGRRVPAIAGALLMVAAFGTLSIVAGSATVPATALLLGVIGLGFGLSGSPRQAAALEAVEPNAVGMAAGTYITGRYLGGVLGAMLAGSVLGSSVTSGAVGFAYGLLAGIALAVAVISVWLPGAASSARGSTP